MRFLTYLAETEQCMMRGADQMIAVALSLQVDLPAFNSGALDDTGVLLGRKSRWAIRHERRTRV